MTTDSGATSELGKRFWRRAAELRLGKRDCDNASPGTKLRKIFEGAETVGQITRFTQAGVKLNLPRNRDARLRSTAIGVSRWDLILRRRAKAPLPSNGGGRSSFVWLPHDSEDVRNLRSSLRKSAPAFGARQQVET